MTTDERILETIQTISGIFATYNIPAGPVNLQYLEEKVAKGQEKLVLSQLILYLDDLLNDYAQENKQLHRFRRYSEFFKDVLDNHTDGESLIPRKGIAV